MISMLEETLRKSTGTNSKGSKSSKFTQGHHSSNNSSIKSQEESNRNSIVKNPLLPNSITMFKGRNKNSLPNSFSQYHNKETNGMKYQ